jgi:hypothetical protein
MFHARMAQQQKRKRGKNEPHLDGRALAILLIVVSLLIAVVWFGHARLETNNNPSTQGFMPSAHARP